jgi:FixJ family two-component response regulator
MKNNTVLFVDDEANILSSLRRAVIDQEFEALFANGAQQALTIMKDTPVHVLITDMRMPQMDGLTLLKIVKDEYPDTVRIVLSGYTQLGQVLATINHGDIFRFITKPWQEEDLLSIVNQAIEYYNLRWDKKELELTLQQRNAAYKKMLENMENKYLANRRDIEYFKNFCCKAMDCLLNEDRLCGKEAASFPNQFRIVQQIMVDYGSSLPTVLEEFTMADFIGSVKKQTNNVDSLRIQLLDQSVPGVLYYGNLKLLAAIIVSILKFLHSADTDRNFQCKITSEVYPNKSVISSAIEIGYISGTNTSIHQDEVLTKANFDVYCILFNLLGKLYHFTTTFTYVDQNTSLITLIADFTCKKKTGQLS